MRKIITIVLAICLTNLLSAQVTTIDDPCCRNCVDTAVLGLADQSSTSGAHTAGDATSNMETYSLTEEEENPFWQLDIQNWVSIRSFKITTSTDVNLSDYYIFTSYEPFISNVIDDLLQDTRVESFRVIGGGLSDVSTPNFTPTNPTRYVRIQKNGNGVLKLFKVEIPGTEIEDCSNGKDDDCDGKVDCEDEDCAPIIYNVNITKQPSCEICHDGEFSVKFWTKDINNTEISIDGGISWGSVNSYSPVFDEMDPGEYSVVMRNRITNCSETWTENPVVLFSLQGIDAGDCENGGFENGNFQNWEGFYGTTLLGLTETGTALESRFRIVGGNSQDPEGIPIALPFEGLFSMRLGNNLTGAQQEAIQYCFTVDDSNKDFSFNYAVVLQDPDWDSEVNSHFNNELPYFQYRIYNKNTNEEIDALRVAADVDDPFFTGFDETIAYKGWTCEKIDLSDRLGQEICVFFNVADCTKGEHFGYAYIDGLCNNDDTNTPKASIELNQVYCENQAILLDASGSVGYNQYQIDICVTPEGLSEDCFMISGFNAIENDVDIESLIQQFYPDYSIPCPSSVEIELTLSNGCGLSISEVETIEKVCESYDIDYDEILICAGSQNIDLPITGTNTCEGCIYSWDPNPPLFNNETAFPTIMGTIHTNAFNQNYTNSTTSPEGCIYEETMTTVTLPNVSIVSSVGTEWCNRRLKAKLTLSGAQGYSDFIKVFYKTPNGSMNPAVLIEGESFGNTLFFNLGVYGKEITKEFEITVFWDEEFIDLFGTFITTGDNCITKENFVIPPDLTYFSNIEDVIDVPNAFTPDNDGLNDTFGPFLKEGFDESNVYWGKMQIWYRWGNGAQGPKVNAFEAVANDPNGLDLSQIAWDGTDKNIFGNIVPAPAEVYLYEIWLINCVDGSFEESVFRGNVTLIR